MTNKILIFLLAGTLILFLLLRLQGKTITQSYAPAGIVSLEFASNKASLDQVIEGYKRDGLLAAVRQNILIDFLFIPFYAFFFYTLSGTIAITFKGLIQYIGTSIAFLAIMSGIFDVLENLLMLFSSFSIYSSTTGLLTSLFAGLKFLLLVLNLLFALVFGPVSLFRSK